MGGSPCKAWDWRNPIVQTLFTQGPTRTAVLRARRCYAHGEIRATSERAAQRRQPASGLLSRPGPGGVGPGFSGFGRRYTKGRLPIPWGGKGAADHAKAGQKRQRPGGGRRAGGARPAGAFGPRHVRPFGPNAAPPPPGTLAYRALSLAPSLVSSTP